MGMLNDITNFFNSADDSYRGSRKDDIFPDTDSDSLLYGEDRVREPSRNDWRSNMYDDFDEDKDDESLGNAYYESKRNSSIKTTSSVKRLGAADVPTKPQAHYAYYELEDGTIMKAE